MLYRAALLELGEVAASSLSELSHRQRARLRVERLKEGARVQPQPEPPG